MPSVLISDICDGIATTLRTDINITIVQSYNQLSESINRGDLPLVQVYWENIQWDVTGDTDRTTFGGKIRTKRATFHLDLYAATRSHLNENMGDLVSGIDSIIGVLETEEAPPFFGVTGIKNVSVDSIDRVVFEYTSGAGGPVYYVGARIILAMWIY